MLAKRPVDDAFTQKIICYSTMVLLLVYFMRFVKNMKRERPSEERPAPAPRCTGLYAQGRKPSPQGVKISHGDAGKNEGHKPKKRRHRCPTDQRTTKSTSSYSTDSFHTDV